MAYLEYVGLRLTGALGAEQEVHPEELSFKEGSFHANKSNDNVALAMGQ